MSVLCCIPRIRGFGFINICGKKEERERRREGGKKGGEKEGGKGERVERKKFCISVSLINEI